MQVTKLRQWPLRPLLFVCLISTILDSSLYSVFPQLVHRHGGLAFFIIFLICWALYAFPMLCIEVWLGHVARGPVYAFNTIPFFHGLVYGLVAHAFIVLPPQSVLVAYNSFAFYSTAAPSYDLMMSCNNDWNTERCCFDPAASSVKDRLALISNESYSVDFDVKFTSYKNSTNRPSCAASPEQAFAEAAHEYFHGNLKNHHQDAELTEDAEHGGILHQIVIASLAVWFVVGACLFFGPLSMGVGIGLIFTVLLVLLLMLTYYWSVLPGARYGRVLGFGAAGDLTALSNFDAWYDCIRFLFFDVRLATGTIMTIASHSPRFNAPRIECVAIFFLYPLAMLASTATLFSLVGFGSQALQISFDSLFSDDFGFTLWRLPSILQLVPNGRMLSSVFFACQSLLGLTTIVTSSWLVGACVLNVLEMVKPTHRLWPYRIASTVVTAVSLFLISIVYCSENGLSLLRVVKEYAQLYVIFELGVIGIFFFYAMFELFGRRRHVMSRADANSSKLKRAFNSEGARKVLKIIAAILVAILSLLLVACTCIRNFAHPSGEHKPTHERTIGWLLSAIPFIIGGCCVVALTVRLLTGQTRNWKRRLFTPVTRHRLVSVYATRGHSVGGARPEDYWSVPSDGPLDDLVDSLAEGTELIEGVNKPAKIRGDSRKDNVRFSDNVEDEVFK